MITFAIINSILLILLSALMGATCGLCSYFLDFCFWPKSIFKGYLPWLAKTLVRIFKPKIYKEISLLNSCDAQYQNYTSEAENIFFYSMLGGCAVCFNIWIAMLTYFIICMKVDFLPWYYCPVYIFVSSFTIRKLVKATY